MRILGIIILAVLMGLTSWVIASVWTWLVPFYVAAIVLILVLPQGQLMDRPTPPDGYANCASGIASTADSSRELPDGVNLQGKSGHETSGLAVKPTASTPVKRRRRQNQTRKRVKAEPELIITTTPAAWIQISPGKFVRADSQDQGLTSAAIPHVESGELHAYVRTENLELDLVKETDPLPALIATNVPNRECRTEDGTGPATDISSEEVWPLTDPGVASTGVIPSLQANTVSEAFGSEPGDDEHGIPPSVFRSDLLTDSLENLDDDQRRTDLQHYPRKAGETPTEPEETSKSRSPQARIKPRSTTRNTWSRLPATRAVQQLRNVRPVIARDFFAGNVHTAHRVHDRAIQWFSNFTRCRRGYQARSPPKRY